MVLLKCVINNIKNNLTLVIVLSITFLLGIIFAFFIKLESFYDYFIENVINLYNVSLSYNSNPIKYFLKNILNSFLLYAIIFLISFNKFTFYLNFLLVFLKGATFIIGIRVFYFVFGFTGIIIFVLLFAIDTLITTLSIIIFVVNTNQKVIYKDSCFIKFLIKSTLLSFCISVIGSFIEFLLLISIFRPFLNFY